MGAGGRAYRALASVLDHLPGADHAPGSRVVPGDKADLKSPQEEAGGALCPRGQEALLVVTFSCEDCHAQQPRRSDYPPVHGRSAALLPRRPASPLRGAAEPPGAGSPGHGPLHHMAGTPEPPPQIPRGQCIVLSWPVGCG